MHITPARDIERSACLNRAFELGFSKTELWNLDRGICRMLLEIWALIDPAVLEDYDLDPDFADEVILACARQGIDDTVPEAIEDALQLLPSMLIAIGHEQVVKIGQLVQIFADYTVTHPDDLPGMTPWRTALAMTGRVIETEAPLISLGRGEHPTEALEGAMEFLVTRFRDLWD